MANHPEQFGFEAGGEFAPAFAAAERRLAAGAARRRSDLARATSRVRTSGVRFIPQETLGRGEAEAEAGLVGQFALSQARESIQDRRLREAFQRRRQLLGEGREANQAFQRRLAKGQLTGQLIAGGIGAASSFIPRPAQTFRFKP